MKIIAKRLTDGQDLMREIKKLLARGGKGAKSTIKAGHNSEDESRQQLINTIKQELL
jgi:hypothetical protein